MSKANPVVIYHNPRCGKSCTALALLEAKGVQPQVIEYLKTPPTPTQLATLVRQLAIAPEQLVRKVEDIYKQTFQGKTLTDAQWLDALASHPILIERPIVVCGERAVIGRPPEKVLELL